MAGPGEVLPVAAAAGELLLRCGADVARVEDTINRIAQAYGITEAETYATPTGIFISLGSEHRVAMVKRVRERRMALDRVSAINALSRELTVNPLPPAEAMARISAIAEQMGPLPSWTEGVLSGLAAASCTILVGGSIGAFLPALAAHVFVQEVQRMARWLQLPEAVADSLAGATAVGCGLLLQRWFGTPVGTVVAGGIMVLVPGTAFTAAVRDAMAGDLVSAGARALEALLKAAALASGVATALYLGGGRQIL